MYMLELWFCCLSGLGQSKRLNVVRHVSGRELGVRLSTHGRLCSMIELRLGAHERLCSMIYHMRCHFCTGQTHLGLQLCAHVCICLQPERAKCTCVHAYRSCCQRGMKKGRSARCRERRAVRGVIIKSLRRLCLRGMGFYSRSAAKSGPNGKPHPVPGLQHGRAAKSPSFVVFPCPLGAVPCEKAGS